MASKRLDHVLPVRAGRPASNALAKGARALLDRPEGDGCTCRTHEGALLCLTREPPSSRRAAPSASASPGRRRPDEPSRSCSAIIASPSSGRPAAARGGRAMRSAWWPSGASHPRGRDAPGRATPCAARRAASRPSGVRKCLTSVSPEPGEADRLSLGGGHDRALRRSRSGAPSRSRETDSRGWQCVPVAAVPCDRLRACDASALADRPLAPGLLSPPGQRALRARGEGS